MASGADGARRETASPFPGKYSGISPNSSGRISNGRAPPTEATICCIVSSDQSYFIWFESIFHYITDYQGFKLCFSIIRMSFIFLLCLDVYTSSSRRLICFHKNASCQIVQTEWLRIMASSSPALVIRFNLILMIRHYFNLVSNRDSERQALKFYIFATRYNIKTELLKWLSIQFYYVH